MDQWRHARMVAEWGYDYYSAELDALDRLASRLTEATATTKGASTGRSLVAGG